MQQGGVTGVFVSPDRASTHLRLGRKLCSHARRSSCPCCSVWCEPGGKPGPRATRYGIVSASNPVRISRCQHNLSNHMVSILATQYPPQPPLLCPRSVMRRPLAADSQQGVLEAPCSVGELCQVHVHFRYSMPHQVDHLSVRDKGPMHEWGANRWEGPGWPITGRQER